MNKYKMWRHHQMVTRFTYPPERKGHAWISSIIGPLVAAMIAIAGSYVTMEKQMARIDTSVTNLTTAINKVSEEQSSFFKASYVPLMVKVEQQGAAISELKALNNAFKEEMRLYHPVRPYRDRF